MSHNLYFRRVRPNGHVDFPIQIPTEVSRQVINLTNDNDRLLYLRNYLEDCEWNYKDICEVLEMVADMMDDENLTLMVD
jgi:hypothetical protein